MVLPNDVDLLNPPDDLAKRNQKLKRLVQSPNSFFMDFKCQGCFNITTVFSHSQTVVVCGNCQTVLCQLIGGRARLTKGCSFRRKETNPISYFYGWLGIFKMLVLLCPRSRLFILLFSRSHRHLPDSRSLSGSLVRSESALTLRALVEIDPTCVGRLVNYGITTLKALRENVSFGKEDSFCKRAARKLLLEFKSDSFSKETISDGTIIIVLGDAQTRYIVNVVREENEKVVKFPPSISIEISSVTTSHHRKTTVEANTEKSRYHCKSAIHFRCNPLLPLKNFET
ncbi:unnamed protein product [Lactuca saligna]|uniref:40S ribosomal protein S27 n=1 Tax=Lactuca saligna TaxID=75948 RepID=A0AA36E7M0_LACSI|nr:unnamed protein product [Lactuca saligna]